MRARVLQRLAQLLAVRGEPAVVMTATAAIIGVTIVVAEVLERGGPHPTSCRVPHAVGDDEEIARVLVEELVGLGVQRVGRRVPDDLVDADDVAATATVDVAQADEEHGAAAHARDVDRPGEWDREARLGGETVERVVYVEIRANQHTDRTS